MSENILFDMWYVACASGDIKKGKMKTVTMLGQQVLLGRGDDGDIFALRDFCPHRGIPLSYGTFDGKEIECCYHGWCFNTGGVCTKIPSFTEDNTTDISRIKVTKYPAREAYGAVWVYVPQAGKKAPEILPEFPAMPAEVPNFYHVESVTFPCEIDHAVIGLMDPSHGPFVHKSWWWRTQKSIHTKRKNFKPFGLGFKMVSHKPSSNSRAYKILGGQPVTEIAFQLPGLRTEHIQIGKNYIVLLTALTPAGDNETVLHQFAYSSITFVTRIWPLLRPFGKSFIAQDLDIVKKQQEGLRGGNPTLLLLGDADQQALWYYKLKKEYAAAQAEERPFENKLPEKTLVWRS